MMFGEPFGGLFPGARGAVLSVLLRTDAPLTGRQVHNMVRDNFSLSPVQQALKALATLGLVETRVVGRAGVHTINDDHAAIPHLRALADPVGILRTTIDEAIDSHVQTVILFGSIARGESTGDSDIDLAVIASAKWERRIELEDYVRAKLGNDCEVLLFTEAEFETLAAKSEPVVADILRDGIALFGTKPRARKVTA